MVLERLRDVKGMITTELEDEHDQRARYAEAARDALADAAAAGGRFAFDEGGVTGPPASRAQVADCAADLAVTIVLALRKRILTDGSGTAVERANTAYKEWRGARVERLCADAARRAFSPRGRRGVPGPTTCASSSRRPTRRATRARSTRARASGPPARRSPVDRPTRPCTPGARARSCPS